MKLLLDTQILLWAAAQSDQVQAALPGAAAALIDDTSNSLYFSVASLWEVSIKSSLNREDFQVDARILRRGLLESGYVELSIMGAHALGVLSLPPIHKDPFDRMLVAQAVAEGLLLVTADAVLGRYPGPIRRV